MRDRAKFLRSSTQHAVRSALILNSHSELLREGLTPLQKCASFKREVVYDLLLLGMELVTELVHVGVEYLYQLIHVVNVATQRRQILILCLVKISVDQLNYGVFYVNLPFMIRRHDFKLIL